jgi:hypothetical protein
MSSAYYPQGMHSYNNSAPFAPFGAPYASWKGTGPYSYPAAITSGNIRPLTNRDQTNNAPQKFGLPRPLKWQYRKGTTTEPLITIINPDQPNEYIQVNRESRSSVSSSLIGQTIDQPGRFSVKHNPKNEINEKEQLNKDCATCHGIGLVTSFSPEPFLTNNPEPVSCSPKFCCNEEKKALQRVIYASTNLKKNYYNTHAEYMANRCQTYEQKAFNFYSGPVVPHVYAQIAATNPALAEKIRLAKPGSPLSYLNMYVANCYPETNPLAGTLNGPNNPKGCKLVVYKPSNPQFAVEGGVSSSTRTLKLTVDTISTNLSSIRKLKGAGAVNNYGGQPFVPFVYKAKVPPCNPSVYIKNGNPKTCVRNRALDHMYKAISKLGNIGNVINGTQVSQVGMSGARS